MTQNILEGIEAVIFDMDGLLLDSEPAWWKANEMLLGKRGHEYTVELSRKVIGAGQRETMQLYKDLFGFDEGIDALALERKELMYQYLMENISFLDGAVELINELHVRKLPLAIATGGHAVEKACELLNYIGVREKFSLIISSEDLTRGKPHPDIYLHTAEKLSVSPAACLVFEDATQGVMAGVAAGMWVVGVHRDEEKRAALSKAHAELVVPSLRDVLPLL